MPSNVNIPSCGHSSKRSASPDILLSRPIKRMHLDTEPPTHDTAATDMPKSAGNNSQMEVDDEIVENSRPRLDKGKGRAKPARELPETVWTRIFEHYYDNTTTSWDRDGVHRNTMAPLLLSHELHPIAIRVLYRHPHLSYAHLQSFAHCAKLLDLTSSRTKSLFVRHLTIRPSRPKPLKPGDYKANHLFYTINTFIRDVCSLFTDLNSFTLRDTLVLHSADARLLFDSLQLLRPKKARLEIRCWDLKDSLLGRDLMSASAPNVHERYTDEVIMPSRSTLTRQWDRNASISEMMLMQEGWKNALMTGGELQFPPHWIDPPRPQLQPPQQPDNNNQGITWFPPVPPPPPPQQGPQPSLDDLASWDNPPGPVGNNSRGGLRTGRANAHSSGILENAMSNPPSTNRRSVNYQDGRGLGYVPGQHDRSSTSGSTQVWEGSWAVPPAGQTNDLSRSSVETGPQVTQITTDPMVPPPPLHEPSVNVVTPTSTPTRAPEQVPQHQPRIRNVVNRRINHIFANDDDLARHEGIHGRSVDREGTSSPEASSASASATIPPPRSKKQSNSKTTERYTDPELIQQRVVETGPSFTSFMLAHEMRARLIKLLKQWEDQLQAFSFVALDPVASLVVRHPQLQLWPRLAIPHIRVHLPRGVHSLAVFKGVKEYERDKKRAMRRSDLAIEDPTLIDIVVTQTSVDSEPDDEDKIVGGDGSGGDLVNDQTRLVEIEVNTVGEMADDRDWIIRGDQLPSQACRILLGSSDWRDVPTGPLDLSLTFPRAQSEAPKSPSSSQFPSPTFSFVDLDDDDDGDVEVMSGEGEQGEWYDKEAAMEQKRRMEEKKMGM